MHYAAMNGRDDCIEILLSALRGDVLRKMVGLRDHKQRTSVMYASLNGHRGSLSLLLRYGADVCAVDEDGETSLHKLASHGSLSQLAIILEALSGDKGTEAAAALFARKNGAGRTPLQIAFMRGHKDFVRWLVRNPEKNTRRFPLKILLV